MGLEISFIRMAEKGIKNFMTTQKLFKQPQNQSSTQHKSPNSSTSQKSKSYHYQLLAPRTSYQNHHANLNLNDNQKLNQNQSQVDNVNQIIAYHCSNVGSQGEGAAYGEGRGQKKGTGSVVARYDKIRELSNSLQRTAPKNPQKPRRIFPRQPSPLQQQSRFPSSLSPSSPQVWQTMVIKSSRKYFDSCRSQTLEYLNKLSTILSNDHTFIQSSILRIHSFIQDSHAEVCEGLKGYLYAFVDQALEKWKIQSIEDVFAKKLEFMGDVYELSTQLEQRYQQIQGFKGQIEAEREWRERVSQLLKQTYEEDIVDLSRMCRKAVAKVENQVKFYWESIVQSVDKDIRNENKAEKIIFKISGLINEECINLKMKRPIRDQIISISKFTKDPTTKNQRQQRPQYQEQQKKQRKASQPQPQLFPNIPSSPQQPPIPTHSNKKSQSQSEPSNINTNIKKLPSFNQQSQPQPQPQQQ